jgi:dTDP-glucose 4,6-dehydratase
MFGYNEEEFIVYVDDRPFNDLRYALNSSKLHELGWKPLVPFEEGLKRTIEWYKDNFNNWPDSELALVPHPVLKPTVTPK